MSNSERPGASRDADEALRLHLATMLSNDEALLAARLAQARKLRNALRWALAVAVLLAAFIIVVPMLVD